MNSQKISRHSVHYFLNYLHTNKRKNNPITLSSQLGWGKMQQYNYCKSNSYFVNHTAYAYPLLSWQTEICFNHITVTGWHR